MSAFLEHPNSDVIAALALNSTFSVEPTQRDAWVEQIEIMRRALAPYREQGLIAFEFAVPRVGRRIDVLLALRHIIVVIEFKVGERRFTADATDQVWDYALDLKNFHSTSHDKAIVPILVATRASTAVSVIATAADHDGVMRPIHAAPDQLSTVLEQALSLCEGKLIDLEDWQRGRYTPTPTIIEAATALYSGHRVEDISRSDASAINLSLTSHAV